MCYALFIGTDEPLAVVDPAVADDCFHLEPPGARHGVVLGYFAKPHIVYAASWQGCGCGWFPDAMPFQSAKKRLEFNRKTAECVERLRLLLVDLLQRHDSVELFLTWEGELDEAPSRRLALAPGDFEAAALPMEQGDFATITRRR
ncbi:MAG: hypothetical protein ACYC6T_02470 [Thermoleophilia bacterium]